MLKKFVLLVGLFALLAFGFTTAAQEDTIADIVVAATEADEAQFTVLLDLVVEAELVEALSDTDAELTVFAPTDEAFATLLEEADLSLDDVTSDVDTLTNILLYHVAAGIALSSDLEDGMEIEMLNGATVTVSIDDETVTINDSAEVVMADIEASNGVIHVIDAVLLPPPAEVAEACVVNTDSADTVRVRVGPGVNRTSVTFLPAGQDFEVLGVFDDEDGSTWFQLVKEDAAPGRAINEAWIAADDVNSTGDCDNIASTDAPPIIPITSSQPQTSSSSGNTSSSAPVTVNSNATIWVAYAPWSGQVPASNAASSRASADLIVEATDELVNEIICGTYVYTNDPSRTTTVRSYQRAVNVSVIDGTTGAVLRQQQFVGGPNTGCPSSLGVSDTLNGDYPPFADALGFILGG
ncbi:MAG: fasciclin domain-containing protein [Chloroflexota bacterium]